MTDKVFIIAEAGVNHNGNMQIAKELIDQAVEAQVDAIKFQIFISENLVCLNAPKAAYQKTNDSSTDTQLDMLKKLELSFADFKVLKEYCDSKKIEFLATAFDMQSLDFLLTLNPRILKVPSGEITNLPYLETCAATGKDIIMSTGMAKISEIRACYHILKKKGSKVSILHCTTAYPTPLNEVNLNVINTLRRDFDAEIGYSDHTEGIFVPCLAVAMGATIIEKHFTLDKNMIGPDHKASLNVSELRKMVDNIRQVETLLGTGEKLLTNGESGNIQVARKSIVAGVRIKEGEVFTDQNLSVKRPAGGISPMDWYNVIGLTAKRNFEKDELIEL